MMFMSVCIHDLFEAVVRQVPLSIATIVEDKQLTYQQLNYAANQLAHHLQNHSVTHGSLVGICLERSLELAIGLLGIIKIGGISVPLDPELPRERLVLILKESKIEILLVQQRFLNFFSEYIFNYQISIICLDKDWPIIKQKSKISPSCELTNEDIAFILFTSGSTGKPKGVMIPHRAVTRNLHKEKSIRQHLTLNPERSLFKSSISFVGLIGELIRPLLVGNTVIFAKQINLLDNAYLIKLIIQQKITTISFISTGLQIFLNEPTAKSCNHLKTVFCSGEILSLECQERFFNTLPTTELYYIYGLTETCGTVTSWHCQRGKHGKKLPIGRAVDNVQVHILDNDMSPVPIGDIGELYIDSVGLACGYLNHPKLTNEKFISNPFSDDPDSLLYKTGDLARYLPDSNIEYLGRLDHQVKIRGFRIELGEIETTLSQHPSIQKSAVIAHEESPNDKRLVAYFMFNTNKEQIINNSELRAFLREKLPSYMIPSVFIQLEVMPTTPNGKIDRHALSTVDYLKPKLEEIFVSSSGNKLEQQLTEIWKKTLKKKYIEIYDNFFDLGGHSLLAVTLMNEVEKKIGKTIPLATFSQAATIKEMANILHCPKCQIPQSPLVLLQPNGFKKPFFYITPAGITALDCNILVRYLTPDRPFYALQENGLEGGKLIPHNSVEEIASYYIREIRTVQPHGPYFLGGACFGNIIAFEIARQLYKQGAEIALLAMIDGFWPDHIAERPQSKSIYLIKYITRHLTVLSKFSLQEKWNYIIQLIKRIFLKILYKISTSKIRESSLIFRAFYYQDSGRQLSANYIPQVYLGQVSIIKTNIKHDWLSPEPDEDKQKLLSVWSKFATKGAKIYDFYGHHSLMFKEPYVQDLANKLQICLNEAQMNISKGNIT